MSELTDFKRIVYEPLVQKCNKQASRIAALELEKERIDNHNVLQAMRIAALEAAIKQHREQMKRHGPHVPSPIDAQLYAALNTEE